MTLENKAYLKVIQYIRQQLIHNKIHLGDKLPTERELSEVLGMSRNSIREALRAMGNMGIIESRQGSGNYLVGNIGKSFTDSLSMLVLMKQVDYLEISQLRRGIEIQALSLAMNHISEKSLRDLEMMVLEMENCSQEQEAALDKNFHFTILSASGNELMLNIMHSLSDVFEQFISYILHQVSGNNKKTLMKSHRKILESLKNKNLTIGIEAINQHYDIIEKRLTEEKK